MNGRQLKCLAVTLIILSYVLLTPLDALAAGFKVRKSNGNSLPGAVSFTPKSPSGKASTIISSVQSRSSAGTIISYFPSYARTEIYDLLRDGTPQHAISLRGYTSFVVKGYSTSVGSVVMRVETGTSTNSNYRYVGVLALISPGNVDYYVMKASIYSSGTFSVTLRSGLCSALSQEGRSAVLLILGETYRWW
ncbi:hypothetical protein AGMMS49992_23490 [Clostridia bacterium]|nr:hypothetical protein AGMMS49992_23490 [Clostridia bacterium]